MEGHQAQGQAGHSDRTTQERFSAKGFIMAAIGSAVGLGNMWKFPYITGKYGGAAFFALFLICLLVIGLPILLAELTIGRGGRGNPSASMRRLSGQRKWGVLGGLAILCPFIILSYYSVVAGWTVHYSIKAFAGTLFSGVGYGQQFEELMSSWVPAFWQLAVMAICALVVGRGVAAGIEKFNKLLIPAMLVLLIMMMIRAITLPGAMSGVQYFLRPDFSMLTPTSVLAALGHAFFSLSLGMGTILTYGAYVDRRQSLSQAALAVTGGDVLYALLAGLIIFPTCFAFGIEVSQGPGLIFAALPVAFEAMPLGTLFGGLFFLLLSIAAITSAVSLLEVPVAFVMERWGWSRSKASAIVATACFMVGLPSALSVGGAVQGLSLAGKSFFDWMDFISSNIMLPVGGLIVALFAGYAWKQAADEAGLAGRAAWLWLALLRYVAPVLVMLIFLHSMGWI
ncbi:sodium-dependent transporter [Paenibacillus ginsengihumi]|uniref:sodium-dependent transporter n=1 Tax=Paenibacillus ginsengihumi TaxID=431596 RepID=UPI000382B20D|nr:sodium-dependent transporter [Paenibacillus ginsengihumi]